MIFIHATGAVNPQLGREHITEDGFFYCDHCRCYTNANLRACCDAGRADDKTARAPSTNAAPDGGATK